MREILEFIWTMPAQQLLGNVIVFGLIIIGVYGGAMLGGLWFVKRWTDPERSRKKRIEL